MTPTRLLLVVAAVLFAAPPAGGAERRPPNVVFILADDLGQRDLGAYGSTFYETPHLDALARAGVRFTDAYAACNVCSPTRAAILTGRHPARLRITDWIPGRKDQPTQKLRRAELLDHLPLEEVTTAEALKRAGYATAFVGKWHLGGPNFYPEKQGFDVNVGGFEKGSPPTYFSPYKIPTLADGPAGEYLTDRLTDEAVKFIESNKDKPFYLYVSHYAVHNPQLAKADAVAKFRAKAAANPGAEEAKFVTDLGRRVRQVQDVPVYAANLAHLDESVGRIAKALADLNLTDDTIVVFTSDNGGLSTSEGTPTSNVPLRMGKGWNYEGGLRVPLIVRAPAAVAKAGTVCETPVVSTDFHPTFCELAGVRLSGDRPLDGFNIAPLLKGETPAAAVAARPIYWHYPHYSNQGGGPSAAVRVGDFKLIEWFETGRAELYNLRDDLSERTDLSAKLPERAAALRAQLQAWQKSVDAAFPSPNPDYDPNAKPQQPNRPRK
jgi:arylsulfatase A-like enzyme